MKTEYGLCEAVGWMLPHLYISSRLRRNDIPIPNKVGSARNIVCLLETQPACCHDPSHHWFFWNLFASAGTSQLVLILPVTGRRLANLLLFTDVFGICRRVHLVPFLGIYIDCCLRRMFQEPWATFIIQNAIAVMSHCLKIIYTQSSVQSVGWSQVRILACWSAIPHFLLLYKQIHKGSFYTSEVVTNNSQFKAWANTWTTKNPLTYTLGSTFSGAQSADLFDITVVLTYRSKQKKRKTAIICGFILTFHIQCIENSWYDSGPAAGHAWK